MDVNCKQRNPVSSTKKEICLGAQPNAPARRIARQIGPPNRSVEYHNPLSSRLSVAKFLQTLYLSLERPNGLVLQEEYSDEERLGGEPSPRFLDRILVLPSSSDHPVPNLDILLPGEGRPAPSRRTSALLPTLFR